MRNTSDSEPIQGIRLRKEVPNMGHFFDFYEQLSGQPQPTEKQTDSHLSRLSTIAPVDDVKLEAVCKGMYMAAHSCMDNDNKKIIEVPEWTQCGEDAIKALDRLLYLLEFHRADKVIETLFTLTNIIKLLEQMDAGIQYQKDIERLHFLRLFLWDVIQ